MDSWRRALNWRTSDGRFTRPRGFVHRFSNTLAPSIVGASLAAFELLSESTMLRDKLQANTTFFREEMVKVGTVESVPHRLRASNRSLSVRDSWAGVQAAFATLLLCQ
jgi:hypothetical protein